MQVVFVSQCDKKALSTTRRVLDLFADRIGTGTWQTEITQDGLAEVKKLLGRYATKSTAVSCSYFRTKKVKEVLWIVGNKSRFGEDGCVPIYSSRKDIMHSNWENDWHYLPLIKALAGVSALLHDFGKSSAFFQNKLASSMRVGDPLRHEWISTLFLNAYVGSDPDTVWLQKMQDGQFDNAALEAGAKANKPDPLAELPSAASAIAWLIVSHHRMPSIKDFKGVSVDDPRALFKAVRAKWGYQNKFDDAEYNEGLIQCLTFPEGLPSDSCAWKSVMRRHAGKLSECLPLLQQSLEDGSWRLILSQARLALMLGDHGYSSQDADPKWSSDCQLYANTVQGTRELKQKLDEHLVGVAKNAVHIAHLLPAFENLNEDFPVADNLRALRQKSVGAFAWQEKAVARIAAWRDKYDVDTNGQFGFFAVNMASTGTGKTLANAKIMRALSSDSKSLRFILALGLRTLTLQTGDEYKKRLGLDAEDMAVMIGSRAILELHAKVSAESGTSEQEASGSASAELLVEHDIFYDTEIPLDKFSTAIPDNKSKKMLYAPILCATIDHIMPATEATRGGSYILPTLRLMSSDLVIDEVDDFVGEDLIAIGRLVHLAGMLGRKVMISSATIPPSLAEGFYHAYEEGFKVFSASRGRKPHVHCAWFDEFKSVVKSNPDGTKGYKHLHDNFVKGRLRSLSKQPPLRKANIVPCSNIKTENEYAEIIRNEIVVKHRHHHTVEAARRVKVSFGVVRRANIAPCIGLSQYLQQTTWPDDIEVRVMPYHSQQLLILRSAQEQHLDKVLNGKGSDQDAFSDPLIKEHLEQVTAKNLIFILVATTVEEVGRDHHFSWGVIEPSSYRSIIQMGGRVARHRPPSSNQPNVGILQFNIKAILQQGCLKPVFSRPGYESTSNMLETHDLNALVNTVQIAQKLDASPRVAKPESSCNGLAIMEHAATEDVLNAYSVFSPESLEGWLCGAWWLTGVPHTYVRFRKSAKPLLLYYLPHKDGFSFFERERKNGKNIMVRRESAYSISYEDHTTKETRWMSHDYPALLGEMNQDSQRIAGCKFGEISLQTYGSDTHKLAFIYAHNQGMVRTNKNRPTQEEQKA